MIMNLLSVGELKKNGFAGKIENIMLKMIKGAMVVCKGVMRSGICVFTPEVMSGLGSHVASINTYVTLNWHNRLAHINVKGLKLLNDKRAFGKDYVSGIPFCDHCVLEKHHKLSFLSNVLRSTRVLEYIYSDQWGSTIIDDFSKKVWGCLLKDKFETFKSFKN